MEERNIAKSFGNIRIRKLNPMRIAYYRAISEQPEKDAWEVMQNWINKHNLGELFTTRYMGFNNPNPTPGSSIYGYELWVTVTQNKQCNDEVSLKSYEGGLYAVVSTNIYDIVQTWQQLYSFVENSEIYTMGTHRLLEEYLIVNDSSLGSEIQLDLYCPIVERRIATGMNDKLFYRGNSLEQHVGI